MQLDFYFEMRITPESIQEGETTILCYKLLISVCIF